MNQPEHVPAQRIRVSDAEREVVADRLRAAVAEGRLTLDEADERLSSAYAARTADDLAELTNDLPVPAAPPVELTPHARRRLAIHAAVVVVIAGLILTRWVVGVVAFGAAPFFWPVWPLFWLGVTLVVHYRRAHGGRPWTDRSPADGRPAYGRRLRGTR